MRLNKLPSVSVRVVAGVTLALLVGLFVLPEAHAIKRRDSAEASDHPEAVLITARDSKKQKAASASGVLIAPRGVLTAGHAVEEFDSWEITAPYAKDGPVTAKSTTARLHPAYKHGNFENDLAVVLLDSDIDIGQPFPSLHRGDLLPINTSLLVIGRTDNGSVSGSKLYHASVSLVSFPGNLNVYGGNPAVTEGGDSGGPLYTGGKEPRLVAIVSGAAGFTRSNVATDCYVPITSKNRSWILQQLDR